jgi:geranylgeranyl pyrophosphate synthase
MIEDFLKSERKTINNEIEKYFAQLDQQEGKVLFSDFINEFKKFVINDNAKRLHPALLIAAFNGIINPRYLQDQRTNIRRVSLSIEFLHTGRLIQDDLIDDDKMRRNSLTFHYQLKEEMKDLLESKEIDLKSQELETYGKNIGLLGGPYSYILGLNIIKNSSFPEKLKLMAIEEYTKATNSLLKGLIIEEYLNSHSIIMSIEQYLDIAELVRASLFQKATEIGAILAKGNLHYQIEPLSKAMRKIGQAYAITDDILDVRNDVKAKNKNKFPYLLALNNIDENQSSILKEIYNKDKRDQDDIDTVYSIFTETNALRIAKQFAANLIMEGKQALEEIYPDLNKEQKEFFTEFADYTVNRVSE